MKLLDKFFSLNEDDTDDDGNLASVDTMFGHATVYDLELEDQHILRVLDINGYWQSACYVDDPTGKLAFGYHEVFDRAFGSPLAMPRMLMLGGGALSYPRHVVVTHPNTTVNVVEIDPQVINLAKQWFLLDGLTDEQRSRLRVTCTDAISYLEQAARTGEKFDFIANDLFAAEVPSSALMNPEGLALIRSILNPQGIYAANVIAAIEGRESKPLRQVQDALGSLFSQVETISLGEDEPHECDNNVVFASNGNFSLAEALGI